MSLTILTYRLTKYIPVFIRYNHTEIRITLIDSSKKSSKLQTPPNRIRLIPKPNSSFIILPTITLITNNSPTVKFTSNCVYANQKAFWPEEDNRARTCPLLPFMDEV